jgi:hypothetical protein
VYDDPLKWTSLYRLNMNILEDIEVTENFEYQELVEVWSSKSSHRKKPQKG